MSNRFPNSADASAERQILSVSQLNRQALMTIEQRFNQVWVSGELSSFARPGSGHWYFTLKDSDAQVRCAMFANANRRARMQPANGQQVLLRGRVSLYEGRGEFQIIVEHIEPAGEGALRAAFDGAPLFGVSALAGRPRNTNSGPKETLKRKKRVPPPPPPKKHKPKKQRRRRGRRQMSSFLANTRTPRASA